jgi:hypothetical protein
MQIVQLFHRSLALDGNYAEYRLVLQHTNMQSMYSKNKFFFHEFLLLLIRRGKKGSRLTV